MNIDHRLNYNCHVLSLSKKLSAVVGVLHKLYDLFPQLFYVRCFFALFQSVLSYGIAVWGGCGKTNRGKIEAIQRRAFKLLDKLPYNVQHPLSFEKLYIYNILPKFHAILSGCEVSNYFHNTIISLLPDHTHATRFLKGDNILLPPIKKTVSQRQFLFNAVKTWNERPNLVRNIQNLREMKRKLKKWL